MGALDGKVAWITGSGRGIGFAIAEYLAGEGAKIVLHDIQADIVNSAADVLRGKGHDPLVLVSDVSNADAVQESVNTIVKEAGSIDILVNNAGVTRDTLMMRMKEEDWDLVLRVNLKGAFLCTKTVARPMMKKRWGRIINISSVVGLIGNVGQVNYSASKAGMLGLTKSSAKELASRGITVNAIAPGYIETEMTASLPEEIREAYLKSTPVGRPGKPEDIAGTIVFLSTEAGSFITGQVINVDGGMVM